MYEVINNILNY